MNGSPRPRTVALLVFEGVYLLDLCGPLEIFTDANTVSGQTLFSTRLVAARPGPVRAHTGLPLQPDHALHDCPPPDILVLPGGDSELASKEPALVPWLRRVVPTTEATLSVCTGAFMLAAAGLLDGLAATTWHGAFDRFSAAFPQVALRRGERVVDNGRLLTTAGVSAGVDGALQLVGRLHGPELARQVAAFVEWPTREQG